MTSSNQKNNDRIFYIGLFILSLGSIFFDRYNVFGFGKYISDNLGLSEVAEIFKNIYRYVFVDLYFIHEKMLIFWVLLLLSIIIKLIKENRIGELKRINYLSVIVGLCLYCLLLNFLFFRYRSILWGLRIITLLISAITNGILIFKRKKNNKTL